MNLTDIYIDQSPIPVVGNSAAIIGFCNEIFHRIEWNPLGIFVQEDDNEVVANSKVAFIEIVRNVETQ